MTVSVTVTEFRECLRTNVSAQQLMDLSQRPPPRCFRLFMLPPRKTVRRVSFLLTALKALCCTALRRLPQVRFWLAQGYFLTFIVVKNTINKTLINQLVTDY